MNREDERPEESWRNTDPDDDVVEAVEQQLRKSRPRRPRLDIEAIERRAREIPPGSPLGPDDKPGVVPRSRSGAFGRDRRYRVFSAMAGSWMCGAVVGAVVVFLAHRRPAPVVETHRDLAQSGQAPSVAAPQSPGQPSGVSGEGRAEADFPVEQSPPPRFAADSLLAAVLLDAKGSSNSRFWRQCSTLHAGMHLRGLGNRSARDGGQVVDASLASPPGVPPSDEVGPGRQRLPSAPVREVTRGELLRELLPEPSRITPYQGEQL